MTFPIILVAHKKAERCVVYYDPKTREFKRLAMVKEGEFKETSLGRDFWTLDRMLEEQGFTYMKGVVLDPIEDKLFLDKRSEDYLTDKDGLSTRVSSILQTF